MPSTYFPLRWESTGDQWWYASPIDWAAANGHYDLVHELIRLDGNHLIQLTSLRRIRRLESVWDDDEHFADVAKRRSEVAQKLYSQCEAKGGKNSLIRAGYGGWLLYTTASAGDLLFVKELLEREPLLVFGEGEYGVTDMLYAAARSKSCDAFRLVLDFAVSPRFSGGVGKEVEGQIGEVPCAYRREMMNRAVHAAARGGNLMMLKELLGDCSDVLAYKDDIGSNILHSAAGRGQVEVVRYLATSFDITNSSDNQGNTALHVAAYRGQLAAVEALLLASPSIMYLKNTNGETFLHMTISSFQTPTFRRVDHQVELMKQLVHNKVFNIEQIINAKTNDGRTALHLAIIGNIHADIVELLMTVSSIDVNVHDNNSLTALDHLKQRPSCDSSDILTRRLISAGGVSSCQDYSTRRIIASHLRGIGSSPGTSFCIPDSEIFLQLGIVNESDASSSARLSTDSTETCKHYLNIKSRSPQNTKKPRSTSNVLLWAKNKKKPESLVKTLNKLSVSNPKEIPISLRNRYSKESMPSSLPNNKRTLSIRSDVPSPTSKKKFASGLLHGVLQAMPHFSATRRSRSSSFSKSPVSSHHSFDKQKGVYVENDMAESSCSTEVVDDRAHNVLHKAGFVNKGLIRQICFGPSSSQKQHEIYDQSIRPIA